MFPGCRPGGRRNLVESSGVELAIEGGGKTRGRQRQLKGGGELVRVQKGKAVLHCTGRGPATARLGFSLVGRPGIGWTGREGRGLRGRGREAGLALAKLPSWQSSGHSEAQLMVHGPM